MSPLGSISNTQTSQNVLNTPVAHSEQGVDAKGLKNPTQSVEVDLDSNRTSSSNGATYDRAALAKQLNQNKSAYSNPVDMSLQAKNGDPENLVLVIDKKALDTAAQELARVQEEQAAKEAEEAEKAKQEEEDEETSAMGILGHVATVGTIVSLLI